MDSALAFCAASPVLSFGLAYLSLFALCAVLVRPSR
jgi:hypothetical protein